MVLIVQAFNLETQKRVIVLTLTPFFDWHEIGKQACLWLLWICCPSRWRIRQCRSKREQMEWLYCPRSVLYCSGKTVSTEAHTNRFSIRLEIDCSVEINAAMENR